MRVIILYHPKSEHARRVEEFAHDFLHRHDERTLTLESLETTEGSEKARLYGAVQYPAVLALSDDGQLLKMWEGDQLPLINEVAYYETI